MNVNRLSYREIKTAVLQICIKEDISSSETFDIKELCDCLIIEFKYINRAYKVYFNEKGFMSDYVRL